MSKHVAYYALWNEVILTDISLKDACKKYGTTSTAAYRWLKKHPSMRENYMRSRKGRRSRWEAEKRGRQLGMFDNPGPLDVARWALRIKREALDERIAWVQMLLRSKPQVRMKTLLQAELKELQQERQRLRLENPIRRGETYDSYLRRLERDAIQDPGARQELKIARARIRTGPEHNVKLKSQLRPIILKLCKELRVPEEQHEHLVDAAGNLVVNALLENEESRGRALTPEIWGTFLDRHLDYEDSFEPIDESLWENEELEPRERKVIPARFLFQRTGGARSAKDKFAATHKIPQKYLDDWRNAQAQA